MNDELKWITSDELYNLPDNILENPDSFAICSKSHPSGRRGCWAQNSNTEDKKDLLKCRRFKYEDDYDENNPDILMICNYCHTLWHYGVCELHLETNMAHDTKTKSI